MREENPEHVGALLGLITHDLRNPLAALSSNVGFLQMVAGDLEPEAKEAIADLQISVEALGRIADSLELLGHELSGRKGEPPAAQEVGASIRSVQKSANRSAASHEVELVFEFGDFETTRFLASSPAFTRALAALIENALTVAPTRSGVQVCVRKEEDDLIFRVEDRGPALTQEMLEALKSAESQNRLKSDRRARYSRGLGLFTVRLWAARADVQFRLGEATEGSALELVAKLA